MKRAYGLTELSKRLEAFRSVQLLRDDPNAPRWWVVALGAAVLVILIFGTWYAGRQSGSIQDERLSSALNQLTQQVASMKVQLEDERAKRRETEKALISVGKNSMVDQQAQMRRQILELEAAAGQYKAIIDRQERALADNLRLLSALSTPGAHLFLMKDSDAAAHCTAYALVVENLKVLVIASNLPKLNIQRQFQLWVERTKDPKIVSGGAFSAADDNRVVLEFDDPSVISDISLIEVTDEPRGGSSEPSGTKLLFVNPESPSEQQKQSSFSR
jgi:Anti-sigma-K factor rskA